MSTEFSSVKLARGSEPRDDRISGSLGAGTTRAGEVSVVVHALGGVLGSCGPLGGTIRFDGVGALAGGAPGTGGAPCMMAVRDEIAGRGGAAPARGEAGPADDTSGAGPFGSAGEALMGRSEPRPRRGRA